MQRFIDLIKRRPLLILGAVIGVVALWWLLSSSGSKSDGAVGVINIGPTEATVMANRDITLAQMAVQSEGARNQSAIELAGIAATTAVKLDEGARYTAERLATIDAGSYDAFLSTSKSVTEIQAERDISLLDKSIAGGVELASINANAYVNVSTLNANTDRALAEINAKNNVDIANVTKDIYAGQAQTQVTLAGQAATAAANVLARKQAQDDATALYYINLAQSRVNAGLAGAEETAALEAAKKTHANLLR